MDAAADAPASVQAPPATPTPLPPPPDPRVDAKGGGGGLPGPVDPGARGSGAQSGAGPAAAAPPRPLSIADWREEYVCLGRDRLGLCTTHVLVRFRRFARELADADAQLHQLQDSSHAGFANVRAPSCTAA